MGKRNGTNHNVPIGVQPTKSNISNRTQSKTCSEVSQYPIKTVFKTRRRPSISTINTEDRNLKKDMCMETDFCILRRYIKKKRNLYSEQNASSLKTYLTLSNTATDINDEAYGDSPGSLLNGNDNSNIKVTTLLVENLKNLISEWVRKEMMGEKHAKKKLVCLFDSILENFNTKNTNMKSTGTTYILDKDGDEVGPKKAIGSKHKHSMTSDDSTCNTQCMKYSRYSIPVSYKRFRVISSLSIPRNFYTYYKKSSNTNKERIAEKTQRAATDIMSSSRSQCEFILRVTNDYMKTQATGDGIMLIPEDYFTKICHSSSNTVLDSENIKKDDKLQENLINTIKRLPSLIQTIYVEHSGNLISSESLIDYDDKHYNFLTEENRTSGASLSSKQTSKAEKCHSSKIFKKHYNFLKFVHCDFIIPEETCPVFNEERHSKNRLITHNESTQIPKKHKAKRFARPKYDKLRYKHYKYLYKNIKECSSYDKQFYNNIERLIKFYYECKENKNIQLKIHINASPTPNNKDTSKKKEYKEYPTIIKETKLKNSDIQTDETAKLLKTTQENASMAIAPLELFKEIKILKNEIKKLSFVTKKAITQYLAKLDVKSDCCTKSVATIEVVSKPPTRQNKIHSKSKGIQITNIPANLKLLSGMKLTKEPKKEITLKKRSSSYHAIENETVIKVTEFGCTKIQSRENNIASQVKAKSLQQVPSEHNKELLAFYYKDLAYNIQNRPPPCNLNTCKMLSDSDDDVLIPVNVNEPGMCNLCSSVVIDLISDDKKPFVSIKKRRGMPCWESCLYCILLWIPVIVILYFMYDLVIKDMINSKSDTNGSTEMRIRFSNHDNTSRYMLKMSDFGF